MFASALILFALSQPSKPLPVGEPKPGEKAAKPQQVEPAVSTTVKTCSCSKCCTCGCNEGKACTCCRVEIILTTEDGRPYATTIHYRRTKGIYPPDPSRDYPYGGDPGIKRRGRLFRRD